MGNLKELRAVLAAFRPPPDRKDLIDAGLSLYQAVSKEIMRVEGVLSQLSETSDRKWHALEIPWDAVLPLEKDMREVLALLLQKAQSAQDSGLEKENQGLREKIIFLEKSQKVSAQTQVVYVEKQSENQSRAEYLDYEIAARLMGELADNLPMDEIEARLALAEGELVYCKKQLDDSETEQDARAGLEAKALWMEQVKRWWALQRELSGHANLLNANGQVEANLSDQELRERAEHVAEFQAMEAQNAQLRQRLAELTQANRQIGLKLDEMQTENCTVEQLREALNQVDMARKRSERELGALTKMMDDMEADLSRMRQVAKRLREKELAFSGMELALGQSQAALAEAKKEQDRLVRSTESERLQYQKTIEMLEMSAEKDAHLREKIEEENDQLQGAYDKLKQQMQQAKSALIQAEQGATQSQEELTQIKREHQDLQKRFRDLRDEYAQVTREIGKR